ncbi:effector-associated constant component EACC1 [Streptomyces buecherae]|uniref:Uncharacterized protein n=1 Tax=Streptomyces buecherae TaxID=2763006 RepID=A0A7H8N562_9ACTN|nr:hypothetical protein [Streptomyces buecherae]QKW49511.1 hypothetical protein HUT08_08035 [Streptomyces buecherae]
MGDAQLSLESPRPLDDSLELAEWLRHERGLQGHVRLTQAAPAVGELGAGPDLLTVALGSGGIGTVLAGSLATWLQSRRTPTKVRITLTRADRTLEIETGDANEAETLIARFLSDGNGA